MLRLLSVLSLTLFTSCSSFALCQKWSEPQVIGTLDTSVLNESSGIALSQKFSDRMYNINDSGSGPFFYTTTMTGKSLQKYKVNNYKPYDMEDLALGPCGNDSCLFIADIGDNKEKRKYLSVIAIKEADITEDTKEVNPLFKLKMNYPDRKYNSESLVVHPNGDIYLLTKTVDEENRRAMPAKLFKVDKKKIADAMAKGEHQVNLVEVATIDLPYQLYNFNLWGRIPTAMDISKDGKKLLILTYSAVMELKIDFDGIDKFDLRKINEKKDMKIFRTKDLYQQEAITYGKTEDELIYTTEVESGDGLSEIVRHTCVER